MLADRPLLPSCLAKIYSANSTENYREESKRNCVGYDHCLSCWVHGDSSGRNLKYQIFGSMRLTCKSITCRQCDCSDEQFDQFVTELGCCIVFQREVPPLARFSTNSCFELCRHAWVFDLCCDQYGTMTRDALPLHFPVSNYQWWLRNQELPACVMVSWRKEYFGTI